MAAGLDPTHFQQQGRTSTRVNGRLRSTEDASAQCAVRRWIVRADAVPLHNSLGCVDKTLNLLLGAHAHCRPGGHEGRR